MNKEGLLEKLTKMADGYIFTEEKARSKGIKEGILLAIEAVRNFPIGFAIVNDKRVDVTIIDKSHLKQEGLVRVMWRNEEGKRVTSFVNKNAVKKYKQA